MRKIIAIPIAVLLIGCTELQPPSIQAIIDGRRGLLSFVCGYIDDANLFQVRYGVGSGFFVNRQGDFVTAGHVARRCEQFPAIQKQGGPAVWIIAPEQHFWRQVRQCRINEQLDLAACHLASNPFADLELAGQIAPLRLDDRREYPAGLAVVFLGFPFGYQFPIASTGHLAAYDPKREAVFVDQHSWGGFSGGPIYTMNGLVIGILQATAEQPDSPAMAPGMAYGKAAHVLARFLEQEKIPYNQ